MYIVVHAFSQTLGLLNVECVTDSQEGWQQLFDESQVKNGRTDSQLKPAHVKTAGCPDGQLAGWFADLTTSWLDGCSLGYLAGWLA